MEDLAKYSVAVTATSNATADTEDTFIEITPATNTTIKLSRLRIGTKTAASDARILPRVVRKSAAGSGGVSGTIVKKRVTSPAATATATVKTGATAFTVGTVVDSLDLPAMNARAVYEWIPRTDDEQLESDKGAVGISIGILIKVSAASIDLVIIAEWDE